MKEWRGNRVSVCLERSAICSLAWIGQDCEDLVGVVVDFPFQGCLWLAVCVNMLVEIFKENILSENGPL